MNCAFHPQNLAIIECNNCKRALCPVCDHRIKGFPFCQECIVAGIDLLRRQSQTPIRTTDFLRTSSPVFAVLLSLICPGLGAAYNGQNSKALAHFGVFVGFFQMAVLTGAALFVFGFIGAWFFAAVDAYRTARAIKAGLAPQNEDLLTKQLSGNPLVWAIALISLGVLFFVHTTFAIRLPINRFLPVLLVALGVYWLIKVLRRKRESAGVENVYSTVHPTLGEQSFAGNGSEQFRSRKYSD